MATINYNGMELEEVTTPQIFDPPRECIAWDNPADFNGHVFYERSVIAILPKSSGSGYRVICSGTQSFRHCALLPDPPKPRRAKNRELSRWLAQGNGEWKSEGPVGEEDQCSFDYVYLERYGDYKIDCDILVRKWSDTEWHEPDVEYLGINDKDYNFNKKYGEV